jgi:D-alanine-D-alanine ligase
MTVKKHDFLTNDTKIKIIEETEQKFTYPVFVKPCNAGSSVGTAKVRDRGFLEKALEEAFFLG